MRLGPARAALVAAALSVAVAACSGGGQAGQAGHAGSSPVASPGSGPFWVQVTCHDRSSDAGRLQRAISDSSRGATIAIGGSCLLTKGITLLSGRSYTGSGTTGTVLRQAAGMDYVLASDTYVDNASTTGDPLSIRDLTVACNGSGQTDGIIIVNWLADVEHVNVTGCGGSGIVDSSVTANGRSITNTSVNSRFENNFISGSGRYGFYVRDNGTSVTDGYLVNNQIASTSGDAIHLENAAGWTITGNHLYDVGQDALYASRLYGTTIADNYIEDFGRNQRSGTWYGIEGTAQGGTGSVIADNKVFNRGENSGSRYVYVGVTQVNSGVSYLAVTGNVILGPGHGGVGLLFSSGSNHLVVTSNGNMIAGVGTSTRRSGSVSAGAGG